MSLPPGTHTLGPENGTLSVRTGRTGAAAKAGHDLLIHVAAWQATLDVGDDPAQTSIVLDVDPTSLRVRDGTGGMQALGGDDKASIEKTIDDEVLMREAIEFRSTAVQAAADGSRLSVRGELTLVGQAAPIAFDLTVDGDGQLRGSAVVKQTEWGITPYSTLFGTLKVVDEVEVELDASLLPRVAARIPDYERIRPRALKPALLELAWISRASVEAHHKLYQSYVGKRNEILGRLASAGPDELRELKIELSFAVGGIKNHEVYFEHLGGDGGDPNGAFAELVKRDFGSTDAWRSDLKATGMAGRGWAWTAYDWDAGRLSNYLGDAQSSFPIWNATPLVALDVYEHAYFLDFQSDRAAYIDAFFDNLDWAVVNGWVSAYGIPQSA
jgi:Fe-Mn family superoxide dismutase